MIAPHTPSSADIALMSELGIRFDGRDYRYREYRYEQLKDAINYARLEQKESNHRPPPEMAPVWVPPEMPTAEELRRMDEFGVTFDGRYYHYAEFRYDRLADAVKYAALTR
ncbi:hypothetical protein SAMN06265795_104293 [Noviherbaspirillum humi]|uniref:Uncharacterized protein n=1 Tax=Noviherbaspirillum humi TaxID=1688639 RepID=A0A239G8B2_9BURK|nr:hypothetical protein [Noviherbaspirillum humi]SNS65321.1 hypothetical protein SAMN06265795_104293 [Noviherbaspirillum humi]